MSADSSLCLVDVGGSFGRDLSAKGEAAMVAFATEWLTKLYGSDIKTIGQALDGDALERDAVCARRDRRPRRRARKARARS